MSRNGVFIQCLESIQPYIDRIQKSGDIELINALEGIEHKLLLGYSNTEPDMDELNNKELLAMLGRQVEHLGDSIKGLTLGTLKKAKKSKPKKYVLDDDILIKSELTVE